MADTELFWISYVGFGVLFTIAELVAPAHDVRYRKGVPFDLVALAVYQLAVIPLSLYVTDPLYDYIPAMAAARVIPLPIRFVLVYLAADLGAYGIHRLIHTRHLWRVHRFHHSVTELYWLS